MVETPKDIFEGTDQVEVKHYDGRIFCIGTKEAKIFGNSQVGNFVV